ncbi:hypothetical protein ACFRAE_10125 [Sphingobacterium sp. HJSM2_6]|uniref:hypothetical protein n=1 Tax=Sphingobacterium sp. HJSM2_6 TaxID=3366264 RepID=UPI003BEB051F
MPFKKILYRFLPLLLIIIGILFPTSSGGITSNTYYYLVFALIFSIYFILPKMIYGTNLVIFILGNLLLIISTIFASNVFPEFSFGIFPSFFLLFLMYFLNLKEINNGKVLIISFLLSTYIVCLFGFGIIVQNDLIINLILDKYVASYEDLVPNMLALRKPVGTFATHSIAALFIFLFLYLNLKTFIIKHKNIYLINAFLLFLLLIFIRSNTSILYTVISIGLFVYLLRFKGLSSFLPILLIGSIGVYFVLNNQIFLEMFDSIDINYILSSDKNGIAGRYSDESPLLPTIDYILNNPFSPIGLTVSDKLYYSDSGFILYTLRGSIILPIIIYLGFYRFLAKNLQNKKTTNFIFIVIILFEVGYPILINSRFLLIFPFIIIYLNHLNNYNEQ